MDFNALLQNGFVLLDGAIGTMLQQSGLKPGELPELYNITHPELVQEIHMAYAKSGAQILYTNTFGANRCKLSNTPYSVKEIITAAINHAKAAKQRYDCLIALDIGPIGELLEPTGTLSFEEAYDIFAEQIEIGVACGVDLIVIETMTDLYEMRAAVLAAKEKSALPVLCTMTFEQNGRTFTGTDLPSMATTLQALNVNALGINCSLGPDEIYPLAKELLRYTDLPVIVKPNAGLPNLTTDEYNIGADEYAKSMEKIAKQGVQILGGCCGTTPEYIQKIAKIIETIPFHRPAAIETPVVCSYAKTVWIDRVRIIGERINPTGKKLLKEALRNQNYDYILNQAMEQVHAGADILDVNVGLPEIDEKATMIKLIKALQGIVDLPLQIDSSNPEVIEAALRIYNGKAIVNSVNGEEAVLHRILPIAKKYGASVVGLTLDENGIPKKAEERVAIAKRIVEVAESYGIPQKDIFIDCLTLTASAEQETVQETLKAVSMIKALGLKTVLGVSNISFGLPNRELLNQTFLSLALSRGLDLPIINPNVKTMTDTIFAYNLLMNIDHDAKDYVARFSQPQSEAKPITPVKTKALSIEEAIINGLKEDAARITATLLEATDPLDLVNQKIIPALDKVGDAFGSGKVFLPQLIQSAQAVEASFQIIKQKLSPDAISKGKVVLATVKGDIHDIGKNIVKVLLENYGYTVIDLGRDVDYMDVVNAVKQHQVKLVGLSALMTTTLPSMEKTIKLLREHQADCKIVVGGAVLTPEYAQKIGADFYAKDAKETVQIAKQIYS